MLDVSIEKPQVVLVFCAIDKLSDLIASLSQQHLTYTLDRVHFIFRAVVTKTLNYFGGYECQELLSSFMLAFHQPSRALEWCLAFQQLIMYMDWPQLVLDSPFFAEEYDENRTLVFRGPRVKIGIYQDVPTEVEPHSTTGRADYFGPLVNRAARFCHAAAHGGQVVLQSDQLDQILHDWGQQDMIHSSQKLSLYQFGCPPIDENTPNYINQIPSDSKIYQHVGDSVEEEIEDEVQALSARSNKTVRRSDSFTFSELSIGDDLTVKRCQLQVVDIGEYEFKGCKGSFQMVHVSAGNMINRRFPGGLAKSKGKCIKEGIGVVNQMEVDLPMFDKDVFYIDNQE
eukprot:TRINITY_DN41664_c1_g1_i2.p1 TRINITY_DN41664_c1_g1~~TRINITY_DN41664_c1_g1_i2.p1  ORF type:complete len:361 (+),score=34.23 TRINITY_DN41664_c1_g1_i2:61-1083(+)